MNSEKNTKYKACDITLEQYIKLYSPEDYEAYKAGKLPKEDLSEYEPDFKIAIRMRESYTVFVGSPKKICTKIYELYK